MRSLGACFACLLRTPAGSIDGPASRGCRSRFRLLPRAVREDSGSELLLDDPFFEIGVVVEQQRHLDVTVLLDFHRDDVAHLGEIGDGAYRAFVRFERIYSNARPMRQQRAAPAPRAKSADRRQGEYACTERN